jgi:hypothetical protein
MGMPNGHCGGLAYEVEATWGTTPGSAWTWVYPARPTASTLGFRQKFIERAGILQCGAVTDLRDGSYVDGELNLVFSQENDIYGGLLGIDTNLSTLTHTFALDGSVPDNKSLSVLMNYAGDYDGTPTNAHEWIATGVKCNSWRFSFTEGSPVLLTMACTGKAMTKTSAGSAETVSTPSTSYIATPGGLSGGTYTEGGNAITPRSMTIEVLTPKTGHDRRGLSSNMIEQKSTGTPGVNWSLECDLDDSQGNDTIDMLANFLAGTDLGTFVVGSTVFSLSGCQTQGDFPPLEEGIVGLNLSGKATGCALTMVDNIT